MGSRARIGWVLVFMAVVLGIASPGFWDLRNLLNLLQQSGVTAILGIGLTFVILTGGIDLSVGSVLALAGVCAASAAVSTGSTVLAVGTGVAVGAAAGFVNGWVTTKGRIPPFITTLGMMMVARSAAKVFTDAKPISGLPDGFRALAGEPLGLSLIVWVAVVLYGVAHVVLTRTKLGRYTYAIGGNERAAWISGVPIERTKVVVYTLSGGLAGLAAVLLTARLNSASPLTGEMYELYAIAAAVIGGVSLTGGQGRVAGTFVGALIMALLRNGLNSLDVPSAWEGIVVGGVVVGAAIVDRVEHRADGQRAVRPVIMRVVTAVVAVALLGGAFAVRSHRTTAVRTTYTIAFIPKGLNSPFWMSMKEGAEIEATKWNAKVLTLAPERETDVEAEFQIIENFLEQDVDAIVLAPCGAKEILPALAKVNKAKVPIIIVDSDIDRPAAAMMGVTTSTYVGSDNEEGGRLAALFMMEKLAAGGPGGEIAIVQATPGHESTDARQRGFERELAKHGDAPVIVARQPANGERARAYNVAQNILQAHPNLRGIFALNDEMSVAVVEAVDAAGKLPSITVVGFDAAPEALTSIRQNRLQGSVAQYPSEMGRLGVESAMALLRDRKAPPPIVHTKVEMISAKNLPATK